MVDVKKMIGAALPLEVVEELLSHGKMSDVLRDVVYEHMRKGAWADRFAKLDDMVAQDRALNPSRVPISSRDLCKAMEDARMPLPVEMIQWHLKRGRWEPRAPK